MRTQRTTSIGTAQYHSRSRHGRPPSFANDRHDRNILKKNQDMWNLRYVMEADKRRVKVEKESKVEKRITEEKELDLLMDE